MYNVSLNTAVTGPDKDCPPVRPQAIAWTNANSVYWNTHKKTSPEPMLAVFIGTQEKTSVKV